jgi:hypothetical protein
MDLSTCQHGRATSWPTPPERKQEEKKRSKDQQACSTNRAFSIVVLGMYTAWLAVDVFVLSVLAKVSLKSSTYVLLWVMGTGMGRNWRKGRWKQREASVDWG